MIEIKSSVRARAAALCIALAAAAPAAAQQPWVTTRYPQDETKWWWDAD